MTPTGVEFAEACVKIKNRGYTYQEMDCQSFIEAGLKAIGVRKNWRGSNHMWRDALAWKGTVDEALARFGEIPVGAWLFTIKQDGKEPATYTDGINAAHVGCYTGQGLGSVHSTTGGTQDAPFPSSRWTHVGLCKYLDYENEPLDQMGKIREGLTTIYNLVDDMLRSIS